MKGPPLEEENTAATTKQRVSEFGHVILSTGMISGDLYGSYDVGHDGDKLEILGIEFK